MLKKIILALLAFCAIAVLGMALFSYQVIEELPLEELRETRPTVSVEKEKLDQIDEGARVIKEDLAAYWTWNQSDVGFEDEIKFKENAKKIGNTLHRLVNIEGIEKNRITIISATSLEKSSLKHEMKIGNFVIKNSEFLNLDFITFDSVFRFKGLENDVVILTDIDEVTNINEIMYVATSRARLLLIIISNETVINNLKHYI